MKTSAIPLSHLQSLSGSRLAARLPAFVTLTKPRVMAHIEDAGGDCQGRDRTKERIEMAGAQ